MSQETSTISQKPQLKKKFTLFSNFKNLTSKHYTFVVLILLITLISGLPLMNLFKLALRQFHFSLFDESLISPVLNTLVISLFTTFFALLIGTTMGFLVSRTNLGLKNKLKSTLLYPYIIPPYLSAIGWIILANPSVGILKSIFPFLNIYSLGGIVLVLTLYTYTFVFLNVVNTLENMDGSLEESARMCGANPLKIFFTITLPLLRPTLIGSGIIVLLTTLSSFGVPYMVGQPGKVFVLTTKIYQLIKVGTADALAQAMALSLPIVILSFVLLYISEKWLGQRNFSLVSGKHNRKLEINLRAWKIPVTVLFLTFIFVALVMPFATILATSFMKVYGEWNLSLHNYYAVFFENQNTFLALKNSLMLAFGSAAIIAFISFFIAYYKQKTHFRFRNTLATFAAVPYATPGTILALAILFSLLGTNAFFILLFAYIAKYLSYGVKVMSNSVSQVDSSLEEASLMCGASWLKTLRKIWFPVIKSAFTTCIFLVIAPIFSELTMSVLLAGPDSPTIGTRLFQLQEYESPPQASVVAVLVLVVVLGLNKLAKVLSKGKLGI